MLLVGCGAVAVLVALVGFRFTVMWPLQGTAVGVLAGITAMALDERCAALVDTLPRPLWWRTVGRVLFAVPGLLVIWVCALVAVRDRIPPHLGLFVLQGCAAVSLALSVTVARRAAGVAEPGAPFAAFAIPVAAAVALARPRPDWFPVFPVWPTENWSCSVVLWLVVAVAAPLVALAPQWMARLRGPGRPVGPAGARLPG